MVCDRVCLVSTSGLLSPGTRVHPPWLTGSRKGHGGRVPRTCLQAGRGRGGLRESLSLQLPFVRCLQPKVVAVPKRHVSGGPFGFPFSVRADP